MNCVVIESGALVTILVAAVSSLLTFFATWYFSRSRYVVQAAPTTPFDVHLERDRQAERRKSRGRVVNNIVGMAMVLAMVLMALAIALAMVIVTISRYTTWLS